MTPRKLFLLHVSHIVFGIHALWPPVLDGKYSYFADAITYSVPRMCCLQAWVHSVSPTCGNAYQDYLAHLLKLFSWGMGWFLNCPTSTHCLCEKWVSHTGTLTYRISTLMTLKLSPLYWYFIISDLSKKFLSEETHCCVIRVSLKTYSLVNRKSHFYEFTSITNTSVERLACFFFEVNLCFICWYN